MFFSRDAIVRLLFVLSVFSSSCPALMYFNFVFSHGIGKSYKYAALKINTDITPYFQQNVGHEDVHSTTNSVVVGTDPDEFQHHLCCDKLSDGPDDTVNFITATAFGEESFLLLHPQTFYCTLIDELQGVLRQVPTNGLYALASPHMKAMGN